MERGALALQEQRGEAVEHTIEILHTGFVTHDVRRFVTSRPDDFGWKPGQGVKVALDRSGWRDERHPFTPTSRLDEPVFEFTIKEYPSHDGVTTRLHDLGAGDSLIISDAFGTITDQGPGTFIAGGAGITPFLAIFRHMSDDALEASSLVFSNDTPADVICEKELRHLFGDRCHLTCTEESAERYDDRTIDRAYLEEVLDDLDQRFYLCGPPDMVEDLGEVLTDLGADADRMVVEE
jgi:ferredoxin-NADP reductase